MCRFVFYDGEPIHLASLITDPENSLIHQSFDAQEREEPLNGDGFGVAWYPTDQHLDAALFRSITPAWNNQNLRHLARAIKSRRVLAHVRAASNGLAVSEANTHPFVSGPYAFMHNGEIADFKRHRRTLLNLLDERFYEVVQGTTDSECLFAHILQRLDHTRGVTAFEMAEALERSIALFMEHAGSSTPSIVNAVLCNGREAVACRFASSHAQAPSLHLHTGRLYSFESGKPELVEAHEDAHSVIVASEPLTRDASWSVIPSGSMVAIGARRKAVTRPLAFL